MVFLSENMNAIPARPASQTGMQRKEQLDVKQLERYLCLRCRQKLAGAEMKVEDLHSGETARRPCESCKQNCYGSVYRISFETDSFPSVNK